MFLFWHNTKKEHATERNTAANAALATLMIATGVTMSGMNAANIDTTSMPAVEKPAAMEWPSANK